MRTRTIYCYKELIALLGVFAIDDTNRDGILSSCPKISTNIIKIALLFFEDVKLVKTSIGNIVKFFMIFLN